MPLVAGASESSLLHVIARALMGATASERMFSAQLEESLRGMCGLCCVG